MLSPDDGLTNQINADFRFTFSYHTPCIFLHARSRYLATFIRKNKFKTSWTLLKCSRVLLKYLIEIRKRVTVILNNIYSDKALQTNMIQLK